MKYISSTILTCLFIQAAFSQAWIKKATNDRFQMGLHGNVKSISIQIYSVVNKNGAIMNGNVNFNESYTFDLQGSKIQTISNNSYSKGKTTVAYGVGGNMIEQNNYDLNNNLIKAVKFTYDDNGNMVDDNTGAYYIYGKDENNVKMVEQIQNNGIGYIFKYDDDGRTLLEAVADVSLKRYNVLSGSKYDNDGNLIEDDSYNVSTISHKNIFVYNDKHIKTEWIAYDGNDNLEGHGYYTYDNKGDEVEFKWFNPDGSLRYTSKSKYEFDKTGNWIKRYEYHDGVPSLYTERKITYYNSSSTVERKTAKPQFVATDSPGAETNNSLNILTTDEMLFMVLFYDGFIDNRHGWATQNTDDYSLKIENNKFKMKSLTSGFHSSAVATNLFSDNDWYVLSRFEHISGASEAGYGLAFAYKDSGNMYIFEINANGSYRICRYLDGQFYVLLPWKNSDMIKKGNGQQNTLKIRWHGGSVCDFYINGNMVDSIDNFQTDGVNTGFVMEESQTINISPLLIAKRPLD